MKDNNASQYFEDLSIFLTSGKGDIDKLVKDWLIIYPSYSVHSSYGDRLIDYLSKLSKHYAEKQADVAPLYAGMLWGCALMSALLHGEVENKAHG